MRCLKARELTVIGGQHKDVGVSGYLLGGMFDCLNPSCNALLTPSGGMPAFPSLHGLGADQIKNVEIVLADATTVNANDKINSDLLQVLKGDFGTWTSVLTHYMTAG